MTYSCLNSIWQATTGLPKGTTGEHPKSILLISVPNSDIEPLQPGDITEDEVRQMVDNGQEVFFITANVPHRYGVVTVEGGKLAFHTWEGALHRKGSAR